MDRIEISNLNRQFLYRQWDIGKLKSETAAQAARRMNPGMRVEARSAKVCVETEGVYGDDFWGSLTAVCGALDSVDARLYVDARCVHYRVPLVDAGTSGLKGNVQVVVPHLTECYASSRDPPPKETPVCLLHSFPNKIEHCLQWAREQVFEGHFVEQPRTVNDYLTKSNYLETLPSTLRLSVLETLEKALLEPPKCFDECVDWARRLFESLYNHQPRQLLRNFPPDHCDANGVYFWSGAKRPPRPLEYDADNEAHLDFVVAAAFLKAYVFGVLESELKPGTGLDRRRPPPFAPKLAAPGEPERAPEDEEEVAERIRSLLPPPSSVSWRARVVEFEKDDDRNFHIDFISSASNLRATVYDIPPADRLTSRLIAGKIIVAIVTTTAAVAGLACLELYKIFQRSEGEKKKIEQFRNSFLNLALPVIQQSEPLPPPLLHFRGKPFTLWDRLEIRVGDVTLERVLEWFKEEQQLTVNFITVGPSLIYASYAVSKARERLKQNFKDLVSQVSGRPLDPHKRWFYLQVLGDDPDGNQVEDMPPVSYHFA
ncbi:ubiquitin-like modifier-activating enzyme 1 [Schistocerca gregaria]|uniref:ubiquitin-like modifier-activating enzyme 1 n=1 Tax=Schistocerca gregaria TaxID=7010 RepID=UPI00211EFB28|nr:ubiquitin-like modifier-activating enzyme 1 [Schistocerca gregaria]